MQLLTDVMVKQEKQIEKLQARLDSMDENKMKNNLLIFGVAETENEDCVEKIKTFFSVKMEIVDTVLISDAHSKGHGQNQPIRVKLTNITDKAVIFNHAKNLKGKKK